MKVLLVQGYLGPQPTSAIVYPLGLAYIGTALSEDGHSVRICDPNAHGDGLAWLRQELENDVPDVVGVSFRNTDSQDYGNYRHYYGHLGETLGTIRAVRPAVPLVIGGTGFSTFPEKTMLDHRSIDVGVYLEGESTMVELLRKLENPAGVPGVYYREGDEIRFSGPRELPGFPELRWPRRDLVDLTPYLRVGRSIGVQSYRGCPLGCLYCNYPALNGRKIRRRSARDVVDEIECLYRDHSVKEIAFADSVFDLDRSFAEDICEELISRGLDLRWSAYFETYKFDEAWFLLARRAGCSQFYFSPDGATDRTMRALGKRCRETDVENVLDIAARYPETDFRFSLLCGTTGQDWRDVWMSLRFVFRTHVLLRNSRCFINWTRILPNSGLYRNLTESGAMGHDTDLLPLRVGDHRALFFVAPDSPRPAQPIMRWAFRAADLARRLRG